jgi:S-adenosylmethionine/arginine decarboxylase-like enzyme
MTGLPIRFNLMMNGRVGPAMRPEMNTPAGIDKFLAFVAEKSGMTIVTTQSINLDDPNDGEWYGLTGLAMIKTSHIAFHIWPHYDSYYMFDISSCKPFNPESLREEIEAYLAHQSEWHEFTQYAPHASTK